MIIESLLDTFFILGPFIYVASNCIRAVESLSYASLVQRSSSFQPIVYHHSVEYYEDSMFDPRDNLIKLALWVYGGIKSRDPSSKRLVSKTGNPVFAHVPWCLSIGSPLDN